MKMQFNESQLAIILMALQHFAESATDGAENEPEFPTHADLAAKVTAALHAQEMAKIIHKQLFAAK